ncbi:lipoprotein-releasing system ATP-binding protein LolD [bacterium]|nr:MAG: lipoprotein-releasing system ATP-binding protein LolD [bacterium]
MSEPWLAARSLHRRFSSEHRDLHILRGIDLQVHPGEFVAVTGPSGSGKSTLLNLLGTLDEPDEGEIHWGGVSVRSLNARRRARLRNKELGFVFQQHHLLPDFTALENVLMPARVAGNVGREARQRALGLLERVGLSERISHLPGELSGGEQQRVAVARALMNRPSLLLLDEPGGNLDEARAAQLHRLLLDLALEGNVSVVAVTHDIDLARQAGRWYRIEDGLLAAAVPD